MRVLLPYGLACFACFAGRLLDRTSLLLQEDLCSSVVGCSGLKQHSHHVTAEFSEGLSQEQGTWNITPKLAKMEHQHTSSSVRIPICWLQTPALSISAAGKGAAQHQLPGQRLENPGHKAHSSLAMYPKVTGFRDCFS